MAESKLHNNEYTSLNSKGDFYLQKKIGLGGGVAVIAGIIVGSGIFVSPVGILEQVNNSVGVSLLMWVASGLVALLTALCYAELGTSIKESGSDYAYLNRAYGPVLAFVFMWTVLFIQRGCGNAAKAIVFGTYLVAPFFPGDCQPPTFAVKCAAAALMISFSLLNCISVKYASKIQILFTIAKFIGMLIIIVGGFICLGKRYPVAVYNFQNAFIPSQTSAITVSQIGLAFYQGLYAYEGFTSLNFIVEEVKDLHRTLPRSIIIGLLLVTIFYVLMNIAYLSVLTPNEMISSKAVAVTFGYKILGNFAWLMPLTVCLSIAGSANGTMMTAGRLAFVAARNGHLPQDFFILKFFEMIHSKQVTPMPSILWDLTFALVMLIPGDFDTLLSAFSFTMWTFRGLACSGLLYLRWKKPNMERPYKVPIVIPVLVVILSIFLVVAPLISTPQFYYIYALTFMVASVTVYYPFIYRKMALPGMDTITVFLQRLFDVAPTHSPEK